MKCGCPSLLFNAYSLKNQTTLWYGYERINNACCIKESNSACRIKESNGAWGTHAHDSAAGASKGHTCLIGAAMAGKAGVAYAQCHQLKELAGEHLVCHAFWPLLWGH
jgi:hypothetical protein